MTVHAPRQRRLSIVAVIHAAENHRYLDELAHPIAVAAVAATGLVASLAVAVQRPVPRWELRLTEWINDAPDAVAHVHFPVMQLGTVGGPLIAGAAIAILEKDRVLGLATATTGLVTWFAAKGVKRLVERGRPLAYLPDVAVREGDGAGLGFVSGHAAVAASWAIMAMVVIPRPWRPIAVIGVALVGVARMVHGVHLAADVVGGWAFGTLLGLAGLGIAGFVPARWSREGRWGRLRWPSTSHGSGQSTR